MQNGIGKTGNAPEAGAVIEIAGEWHSPGSTPAFPLRSVAQQGENAIVAKQARQGAPGDIAAADNQYSLHRRIVALPAVKVRQGES